MAEKKLDPMFILSIVAIVAIVAITMFSMVIFKSTGNGRLAESDSTFISDEDIEVRNLAGQAYSKMECDWMFRSGFPQKYGKMYAFTSAFNNDCIKYYPKVKRIDLVRENVICMFTGGNTSSKCYDTTKTFSCQAANGFCKVEVVAKKGTVQMWKSSCGGLQNATIDGVDSTVKFSCKTEILCSDSDGGRNYGQFGVVTKKGFASNWTDNCDQNKLYEFSCVGNDLMSEVVDCGTSSKVCKDGACVQAPVINVTYCSDSDGGRNYGQFGVVTKKGFASNWTDNCDQNKLYEFSCVGNDLMSEVVDCGTSSKVCKDGACVQAPVINVTYCSDSDYGNNPNVKGKLTANVLNSFGIVDHVEISDYCAGNGGGNNVTVVEYVCHAGSTTGNFDSLPINCPNGCVDGACIQPGNITTISQAVELQKPVDVKLNGINYRIELQGANADPSIVLAVNGNRGTLGLNETRTIGGLEVTAYDIFFTEIPVVSASASLLLSLPR